jgi:NlpC/P60 family putative phage cell wall peptidase
VTTCAEVAAEARRWLATPFAHQGRTKGLGCDCGGLVGGVAMALGIIPPTWWTTVFDPQFGGYGRQPAHGTLQLVCESFMARVDEPEVGDVLLMRFAAEPQHLAIAVDYRWGGLAIVHALESEGRVIEHRLAPLWRSRIVQAYRMPGVA